MQCGSAGDHHIELRTASQQSCHLDGSLDNLFKVVQQQQHLFLTQPCAHQVEQWLTGGLFETERLSNGRHDQFGIAEGCQIHKIDAIGETVTEFGGHLQAQARFAATTRSRRLAPSGSSCSTRSRVVWESRIWPPWPAFMMRAARCTSRPM